MMKQVLNIIVFFLFLLGSPRARCSASFSTPEACADHPLALSCPAEYVIPYIYIYIPRAYLTSVLIGKGGW